MHHTIRLIDDQELPEGHDFMVVQTPGDEAVVFQRAGAEPQPELWRAACAGSRLTLA